MNSKHLALGLVSIGAAFAWMGSAQAATLTHDYDLKTGLADLKGGASLVAGGGSLSAAGYSFGANQGLTLSNSINPSSYSIFLDFTYTDPNITPSFGPYSKILDFKNLTTDSGFYYKSGALNFYDASKSGSAADIATGITPIAANAPLKLALTRDASGQTTAYLNGVQQFSFADTNGDSIFFPPVSSIINFFNDDATTNVETSSGLIARISIYDGALSATDASTLTGGGTTAVPEPFTVVGTLIGGTAALRMRKKLKATAKV
jgi:hypothetical protein